MIFPIPLVGRLKYFCCLLMSPLILISIGRVKVTTETLTEDKHHVVRVKDVCTVRSQNGLWHRDPAVSPHHHGSPERDIYCTVPCIPDYTFKRETCISCMSFLCPSHYLHVECECCDESLYTWTLLFITLVPHELQRNSRNLVALATLPAKQVEMKCFN
jgi:hypothetical protein